MLRLRLIPVLYIKNGLIVRSEGFSYHQKIGNIVNEAQRYNEWDVDELIYIDISRTKVYDLGRDDHKIKSCNSISEIISAISKVCFMPLAFGGGIRSLEHIDNIIRSGADKVTLNSGAFEQPALIEEAAKKYGSQAIVLSIDYRVIDEKVIVFIEYGQKNTGKTVLEWVHEAESRGAGEIFLNAIDRDGQANGYDIVTLAHISETTRLPVIGCGGAGDMAHFVALAQQTKVAAVAAGNWFHFVERSYPRAKQWMKQHGLCVR